jgi:hypothetical protein
MSINAITRRFLCASSRLFLILGTLILFIGFLCRVGTAFYGRRLLRTLEAEMKQMNGTSFSVADAIFNLESGIVASYLLMFTGSAIIFIGIGRIRQVPAPTISWIPEAQSSPQK